MAGSVIMIVVLVLFPVLLLISGAGAAALIGWVLERDRDAAYEGTEYIELS